MPHDSSSHRPMPRLLPLLSLLSLTALPAPLAAEVHDLTRHRPASHSARGPGEGGIELPMPTPEDVPWGGALRQAVPQRDLRPAMPGRDRFRNGGSRPAGRAVREAPFDVAGVIERASHAFDEDLLREGLFTTEDARYVVEVEGGTTRLFPRLPGTEGFVGDGLELTVEAVARGEWLMPADPDPDLEPAGNRVDRARYPWLSERIEARYDGIVQTFRIDRLPGGSGDLLLYSQATGLEPDARTDGPMDEEGMRFLAAPEVGVRYGLPVARDAAGYELDADLAAIHEPWGTRIELRLPEGFLEAAALPIEVEVPLRVDVAAGDLTVLDPDGALISDATSAQQVPDLAFDGTNYLVVWMDRRSGSTYDLYGARVSADGVLVDTKGFLVAQSNYDEEFPAVSFNGTHYFVAWATGTVSGSNHDIYGIRVGTDGKVIGTTPTTICAASSNQHYPRLAWNGTHWLVVWQDYRGFYQLTYAARVAADGKLVDTTNIKIGAAADSNQQAFPDVATNGDQWLVVWRDDVYSSGLYKIKGARVTKDGKVQDTSNFAISPGKTDDDVPSVGFDGTNYLVVWSAYDCPSTLDCGRIEGVRVSPAAAVLDSSPVTIRDSEGDAFAPRLSWSGSEFLVVWMESKKGNLEDYDLYAARIGADARLIDAQAVPISTLTADQALPNVARGKDSWLVAWDDERCGSSSCADIYGARIASSATDGDRDGVADGEDNCPEDANGDQADSDKDGAGDVCDVCPADAADDADRDGVCGDQDNCPEKANKDQVDADRDRVGDACDVCPADAQDDVDGDGLCADADNCPTITNKDQADVDKDGIGDVCDVCGTDSDDDADQVCGAKDNCPTVVNPDQLDSDKDGAGDACDVCPNTAEADGDRDGACPGEDNCPDVANRDQADGDRDGTGDACDDCPADPENDGDGDGVCADEDVCPLEADPGQEDGDGDGIGDVCDACPEDGTEDSDGDGVCPAKDNCPDLENPDQADTDADGVGDACDPCPEDATNDVDEDGVCGSGDNCPETSNRDQADTDTDGVGDACDPCPEDAENDPDEDGICAGVDNCPTKANVDQADADRDGIGDVCDPCPQGTRERDGDKDGWCDSTDNCPDDVNEDQADGDEDGAGDVCDPCPRDTTNDADGDTVCGNEDNCPDVSNRNQADKDRDGVGDSCDACPNDKENDADGDEICGNDDNCPDNANPEQEDTDRDGKGDACDRTNNPPEEETPTPEPEEETPTPRPEETPTPTPEPEESPTPGPGESPTPEPEGGDGCGCSSGSRSDGTPGGGTLALILLGAMPLVVRRRRS